jgi:hypothetical protein
MKQHAARLGALERAHLAATRPLRTFLESLEAPGWYVEARATDGRLWSWGQVEELADSGAARVVRVAWGHPHAGRQGLRGSE